MARISKDKNLGKYTSGTRRCDICNREEYLKKPRRWDICVSCLRKKLYKEGTKIPPKSVSKFTRIIFCKNCNKIFPISTSYYSDQKYCSLKCFGTSLLNREPVNKIWHDKKERNKYYYNKNKNDPQKRLARAVRGGLKSALKRYIILDKNGNPKKIGNLHNLERILGCSIDFLKQHIESQFEVGMSWDNWAHDGWHIDHIYPISKVDLSNEEQFMKINNYRNLRPLWAHDNLVKYNKIIADLDEILKTKE